MTTPISSAPSPVARVLAAIGPFLALLIMLIAFRLAVGENAAHETFWSGANLRNILAQTAIVAIGACGMTMIIVAGGIDLSVGSVTALSAVTAALALKAGMNPALVILIAIGTGAAAGAVNGALIAGLRLAPFIATLGMLSVARGAAKGLADESSVNYPYRHPFNELKLMQPTPLPDDSTLLHLLWTAPGVWIAGLLAAAMAVVMRRTVFGRHCYAIGSNEAAAHLCGIRVERTKFLIYTLAGAFIGLAGLLDVSKLHQGDPTTAQGRELDVIAAVVIGGASLNGGRGTILGSIIGALIMGVLRTGSQQLGWHTWVQEILIGAVIVLAVFIDTLRIRKTPG